MTNQPVTTLDDAVLQPNGSDPVLRSTARALPSVDASGGGRRKGGRADRPTDPRLTQLRRFQWAVRGALVLGVAASVCANVLHAQRNPIAQTIAAWPPLALMLTVELISRVPVFRRALAVVRLLATACIAGIAAYVSYFHMAAVVSRFGEHQPNPYLLPISVDGLIVVASVSLVELAGRIRIINDRADAPSAHDLPANSPSTPGKDTAQASVMEPAEMGDHARTIPPANLPAARSARPTHKPSSTATDTTPPIVPSGTDPATPRPAAPQCETAKPGSVISPPTTERHPAQPSGANGAEDADGNRSYADSAIDPDLAALLPAARAARDTLRHQRRGLTRDSLAAQLRRDGHTIRTSRVSDLLNLLRNDQSSAVNDQRVSAPG